MPTPPEPPGQPTRRPVLEPTYVMRRRRTEALADLVREYRERQESRRGGEGAGPEADADPGPDYEVVAPGAGPGGAGSTVDLATEEMPPVTAPLRPPGAGPVPDAVPRPPRRDRAMRGVGGLREDGLTTRRAAVVVGVTAAALVGFGAALVVPGVGGHDARGAGTPLRPPATGAASRPADAPGTDPDGAGTLREGDSGPAVSELQQRLLRIPDVYRDGATDGRYDAVLRAAVARFQLWYGIRGDESGVYGNDTRRDLESRTVL
ncbi:peptidoglycan-binding domain-containing protein [Streptomyces sp. NBC_00670]|uniref:peptidoglycan-binding domain-containing protein n=1 Tax=Streptomyces sp. NBC_00670 TaxID=2975804 RepID=UPI002E329302|nr:peptidoglycan-binding domain-containing protein [Streptomyces sp. NBC_00670]